ncbi:DNA/RNA non-specific endonuclease [Klebsiella michiganensis]|uniref:DNA/RNA non-specific endonuclease n=1 Tax=Klebsiella michiganensis TaxID=1134687 RepID=A0A7H4N8S7_9ENTR|nr:DNA/RNA non-specific endonuclease [Klebsiella michiganensis]
MKLSRVFSVLPSLFFAVACAATSSGVDHCEVGCPTGGSAQTLVREAYTLNNNSQRKFANWVAYKITKASLASGRSRSWKRDPDFTRCGYPCPRGIQRGQRSIGGRSRASGASRRLGASADWQALNYLSNITPQASDLNQGAWARLEDKERALAERRERGGGVVRYRAAVRTAYRLPCPPRPRWSFPAATGRLFLSAPVRIKANTRRFCWIRRRQKAPVFVIIKVTVEEIERRTHPALSFWPALPAGIAAA